MISWLLAACAGSVLGAWAWSRLRPTYVAWRDRPRETRTQRRNRRVQSWAMHALETSLAGFHDDALHWARKAYRLDPKHPQALHAMGRSHLAMDRETGIQYLEQAYRFVAEDLGPEAPFLADCAYDLACGCGFLSRRTRGPERERYAEQALVWFRIALSHDPGLADDAGQAVAFMHLQAEVQAIIQNAGPAGVWLEP